MIESCRKLQTKVEARLQVLLRNIAPALDNIVTNTDGSVRNMNQYDAEKYCTDQGTRLPTARELALTSMSLGAKGIRETAHAGVAVADAAVQAEIVQMSKDGAPPTSPITPTLFMATMASSCTSTAATASALAPCVACAASVEK